MFGDKCVRIIENAPRDLECKMKNKYTGILVRLDVGEETIEEGRCRYSTCWTKLQEREGKTKCTVSRSAP